MYETYDEAGEAGDTGWARKNINNYLLSMAECRTKRSKIAALGDEWEG